MAFTPIDPNKAEVRITGSSPDYGLDFYIPRGERGEIGLTGPQGPAVPTNLAIGTIEVGSPAPGTIGPQGLTGAKGDPGGLTQTALGSSNLNAVLTTGCYVQQDGTLSTLANNYPTTQPGVLYVHQRTASSILQILETRIPLPSVANTTNVTFTRWTNDTGATWSPWKAASNQRTDQVAGRAIYLWDEVNNRDQLVYGDTGWRDMSSLLINGWTLNSGGALNLRRVGYQVYWRGYNLNGSAATSQTICAIPSGFGYEAYSNRFPVVDGASISSITIHNTNGLICAPAVPVTTLLASNFANWSHPTLQAWPTTLPGTAIGSIPNT